MVSWAVVISLYRGNKWFINRRPVAAESVATVATSTSGFDHVAPGARTRIRTLGRRGRALLRSPPDSCRRRL